MCGICGAVRLRDSGGPVLPPGTLESMTDVMTHRGPDDRGMLELERVALGVRRLSIVDVEGGHQPIGNEDGRVWAVQNGEIYNQRDVRTVLERAGHVFRTRCDTEILPHAYEQYGTGFPDHLNGMFAVAVWDDASASLIL